MPNTEPLILAAKYRNTNSCFGSHFHNAYEIMFVSGGSVQVSIDKKVYTACKNSLILFSNLEEHSATLLEAPFQRYYATISTPVADRLINEPLLISLLKNRPAKFCHVFDVGELEQDFLHFFDLVLRETEKKEVFANDMCALALKQLLIQLYRKRRDRFPSVESNVSYAIYEIQKYIDLNYAKPILIEDLARSFYIDMFYLSHCFKQQTGYSPKQYLMKTRISRSKELLLHTKEAVGNIAYKCGFSDVNNYIRSFKAEAGLTPNQYRKKQIQQV